eukprot:m.100279 g.100279  ORF g.100279 m.100279 type:complete len:997 (-) comp9043_c3_seq1:97-3087(-)
MTSTSVFDIEDLFKDKQYTAQPRVRGKAGFRPSKMVHTSHNAYKRNIPKNTTEENELMNNFELAIHSDMTEEEAVQEAARCLKCADAPCQKGCPTDIDIKAFITCIQSRNWYGAAQIILSSNPIGYTCGTLCMTSELCGGCCNLAQTRAGPINISGLQDFALQQYAKMKIEPRVEIDTPKRSNKIAVIGAGPSSISCATFLARMGYTNVVIFERYKYGGGLGSFEIPEFRLPQISVLWEVEECRKMGVEFRYEKELGKDFTVKSLLEEDGFEAVYLGVGKMAPRRVNVFDDLVPEKGYYDSKEFLWRTAHASKNLEPPVDAPALHGRVVILGGGDVATDCARSALRLGAKRVTMALRRNTTHFRATEEEVEMTAEEQVDFLPYSLPKKVILDEKTGRVRALELYKTELSEDGSKCEIDEDQFIRIKCDFIVSAFGSQAHEDLAKSIAPITLNKWNELDVNEFGQCKEDSRVFSGGDIVGAGTQVEASNDGKAASWGIHKLLQNLSPDVPVELPTYSTEIDDVDISVTMCGVKFPNPYGLASAPPATTCEMIARAFAQGWGFAVTKTFTNDAEIITNVSPRIWSSVQGAAKDRHYQEGFINIELVSEKSADYWCNGITELKKNFPDRVVIASIMCCFDKDAWQGLARRSCEAGADMIEMNLSCPHGMHEKGMGLALGTYPDKVREACRWVVEASTVPVFAKLTPNVTDITVIAQAAKEGGVDGVTAINTVSGLVGFHGDATPGRLSVGAAHNSTYGGLCGNNIRPLAFKGVTAIAKKCDIPIMATGGIDSADVTSQFFYAGASVVQICSAVMNQDFTIIHDLISGLKSILYMKGRKDLRNYSHGMPPVPEQHLAPRPTFGSGEIARRHEKSVKNKELKLIVRPLLDLDPSDEKAKPLMIEDLIGLGLDHVKTYSELNNQEQVIAYVNPELCLNCGKCYSSCNDNGYQAITFDPVTHIPIVDNEKCTGCGICESVCPALNCISFFPRDGVKKPNRGYY